MPITDPWEERYIYLHEWLFFMVNVGQYNISMDPMGWEIHHHGTSPWNMGNIIFGTFANSTFTKQIYTAEN